MPPCMMHPMYGDRSVRPGVVLGIGLGAFVDGIVLHQLAHWHSMASAVLPPVTLEALRQNMRWDGLFHALAWGVTLTGIYLLLTDSRRGKRVPPPAAFTGQLLIGWGAFNVVEGIVSHHLLGLHHVRDLPAHVPLYDWLFLGIAGAGFLLLGWWLARSRREAPEPARRAKAPMPRPAEPSPVPRPLEPSPAPHSASGAERHRDGDGRSASFPAPRGD